MMRVLKIKVNYIALYRTFSKEVRFQKYLRGVNDVGPIKFMSWTHGYRHRGREGE